ncbi:hypothetical protein D3C72_1589010 [compost metagenome]
MVTISAPKNEKMVISTPPSTAPQPLGAKPPLAHRWLTPEASASGQTPNNAMPPMTMKARMAITLTRANQNSNSPKFFTLTRLLVASTAMIRKANNQDGTAGNHACRISAPAMASTGMISTQNHQYNQPMVKPAQGPMASAA